MLSPSAILLRAALLQLALLGGFALLQWGSRALLGQAGLWPIWLLFVAALGAWGSTRLRLPPWWRWISSGFLPALLLAVWLALPAWIYALAWLLCFALFGATFSSRVPLWLSGRRARQRLIELIPAQAELRLLDVGAGLGGVLLTLQRQRPRLALVGYEWALLPWLLGAIRLRLAGYRGQWRWASFWAVDFGQFDLLYAYLSPAPMTKLWAKAVAEMRPGTRLLSYRFAIPEQAPSAIHTVGAGAEDVLYEYRIGPTAGSD